MSIPSENNDTLPPMPPGATPDDSKAGGEFADSPPVSILTLTDQAISDKFDVPLGRDGLPRRKPGRPRKTIEPLPGTAPGPGASAAPPGQTVDRKTPAQQRANRAASEELARAILNTSVGLMVTTVGDEWNFQSPDEAAGMKNALSVYIESKGDAALSPETMLALVVAGYSLPRLGHENTRTKLSKFFGGLWGFLTAPFKRSKTP